MQVCLSTTLNTGHAHGLAKETLILPVSECDEESQPTTQESMFNFVWRSNGGPLRHVGPRGEVEIIAEIAERLLGSAGPIDWQFNTVVYEEEDLYRGQERRDVILVHPQDLQRLGLNENDRVTVHSEVGSVPGISDTALSSNQGRQCPDVLSGGQSIGGAPHRQAVPDARLQGVCHHP
jgi:hypothetical protein